MRFTLFSFGCFLCLSTTIGAHTYALAENTAQETLKVVRFGDTELSCNALSREAVKMQKIVSLKESIQEDAEMKTRGVQAAGAVGSVILGAATAGIGLGVAGFLASEAIASEADQADNLQDKASERRSFMAGIYQAKGCQGPLEHAFYEPPVEETQIALIAPAAGEQTERTASQGIALQTFQKPESLRSFDKVSPSTPQYNE